MDFKNSFGDLLSEPEIKEAPNSKRYGVMEFTRTYKEAIFYLLSKIPYSKTVLSK